MKALRYTSKSTWLYFLSGAILIWLILPISLLDIMIVPKWHAPHWQCDSLGIDPLAQSQTPSRNPNADTA